MAGDGMEQTGKRNILGRDKEKNHQAEKQSSRQEHLKDAMLKRKIGWAIQFQDHAFIPLKVVRPVEGEGCYPVSGRSGTPDRTAPGTQC
jgi:hypothetical protein